MEWIVPAWLAFLFFWMFVLGCAIGSFLNVVIYRLPRGKSVFWPSSRCGACLAPIRSSDNVPLLSYLGLRGRCRACGAGFSMRYFWVELLTGVVFMLLYAVEVGWNVHGFEAWRGGGFWFLAAGQFPPWSWPYFAGHALLASLLIAAVACALDMGRVPGSLAVTGAVAGLAWSATLPWAAGGFASGLAGVLAGPLLLRAVNTALGRAVFDPALLLIAGGFLGCQPTLAGLALAAAAVDPLARLGLSFPRAFALAAAGGLTCAWFGWGVLGPRLGPWTGWLLVPVAAGLYLVAATQGRRLARPTDGGRPVEPPPA